MISAINKILVKIDIDRLSANLVQFEYYFPFELEICWLRVERILVPYSYLDTSGISIVNVGITVHTRAYMSMFCTFPRSIV